MCFTIGLFISPDLFLPVCLFPPGVWCLTSVLVAERKMFLLSRKTKNPEFFALHFGSRETMLTRRLVVAFLALALVAGVVAADDAIDGMTSEQMELEMKKIHDEVLPMPKTQKISPSHHKHQLSEPLS